MNRTHARCLTAALLLAVAVLAAAAEPPPPAPDAPPCLPGIAPLAVRVLPPEPPILLRLGEADAHATPHKHGCARTGGGGIDVRQPAPDTIVVTMTGVGVAGGLAFTESRAGFNFDLCQDFTVVYQTPDVCGASLYVQGRVVGLLRNPCKGSAESSQACASVTTAGPEEHEIVTLCLPGKAIGDKDNQSVLVRGSAPCIPIPPGCYKLRQSFSLSASQHGAQMPGKPASAEFAPAPGLDPSWISYKDPFHGVAKKDFGFQVTLRVVPRKSPVAQPTTLNVDVKAPAPVPPPKPE